jgi:hypothetical protein
MMWDVTDFDPRRIRMSRFHLTLGLALAAVALAACRAQTSPTVAPTPLSPTDTVAVSPTGAVSVPTVTPQPTNTSEPPTATPTSTPALTATPTVPPTPDPNEGVGDVVYQDKLDGTGGWYWTFQDDAASFGVSLEEKQLNTVVKKSGTWRFSSSPDTVKVGDQQIRVSAHTNVCAEADEYAVLFRGAVDAEGVYTFYAFKLRCNGAARLERLQGNDVTVLVDWTSSPAIKPGANADNAVTIWAHKDQMRFYVNDQYLFSAQDATLAEGFYGFLLYDRTNGNMSVSWKGLEVRAVTVP